MKTILTSALIVGLLAGAIMLYRHFYIRRRLIKLSSGKYNSLKPIIDRLSRQQVVSEATILQIASNSSLRLALYKTLLEYNKADLFPAQYFSQEKGAESFLVNWLEFPTELGASPSEIQYVTAIAIQDKDLPAYYVFRFRILAPHWASEYDWMLGVAGPYYTHSQSFDVPLKVYSRFKETTETTAEEEVQWVHSHIGK